MQAEIAHPDARVLFAHLDEGPFMSGADRGYWRSILVMWPHVLIAVSAAPRPNSPQEYVLRFDCSNYPQAAPTARPWDVERNAPLTPARWPTGRDRVAKVFRPDWKGGECLYLPCDRIALEGHDAWHKQHPHLIWTAASDITLYLGAVHELLNSSDYTGVRSA